MTTAAPCPVHADNEWDPLEEVIVGRVEQSVYPPHESYVLGGVPRLLFDLLAWIGGRRRLPRAWLEDPARRQLDGLVDLLRGEGIVVRRPALLDHARPFATPWWRSRGHTSACPRDCFLVLGDQIIEAAMPWRNRSHERHACYPLLRRYFAAGARWISAPRPPLRDRLYDRHFQPPAAGEPMRYVIDESEVVFDAADVLRCGRDLLVQRSNATNLAGIAWLERHLAPAGYRLHLVESRSRQPLHLDTTLMPLGPGRLLVNPEYLDLARLPAFLRGWELLIAPPPDPPSACGAVDRLTSMCGRWLGMNVLMLDEQRVVVEASARSMVAALRAWGFTPIPCELRAVAPFGGGLHCVTLDIRRRAKTTK